MSIRLQFSTDDSAGAALIRAFDHGSFSHVDIVLADGTLLGARDDELGGIPAGVQIRPANYQAFSKTVIIEIPAPLNVGNAFHDFAIDQISKPYDETAIAGFILDRDWRKPDSWFCSELASAALEKSGLFSFPLASATNKITPNMLFFLSSAFGRQL